MDELKPCPFCGFKPSLKDLVHRRFFEKPKVYYYIQCDGCGTRTDLNECELSLVAKWNRRADNG